MIHKDPQALGPKQMKYQYHLGMLAKLAQSIGKDYGQVANDLNSVWVNSSHTTVVVVAAAL